MSGDSTVFKIGDRIRIIKLHDHYSSSYDGCEGYIQRINGGTLYGTWGYTGILLGKDEIEKLPSKVRRIDERSTPYREYTITFNDAEDAAIAFTSARYNDEIIDSERHDNRLIITCPAETFEEFMITVESCGAPINLKKR